MVTDSSEFTFYHLGKVFRKRSVWQSQFEPYPTLPLVYRVQFEGELRGVFLIFAPTFINSLNSAEFLPELANILASRLSLRLGGTNRQWIVISPPVAVSADQAHKFWLSAQGQPDLIEEYLCFFGESPCEIQTALFLADVFGEASKPVQEARGESVNAQVDRNHL